jgi:hypothetical protein
VAPPTGQNIARPRLPPSWERRDRRRSEVHERITSFESALTKATFQLQQVSRQLTVRPLAAFDRHYGNGQFVNQTAEIEADLLLRLASNRCVYGVPPRLRRSRSTSQAWTQIQIQRPTDLSGGQPNLGARRAAMGPGQVDALELLPFPQLRQPRDGDYPAGGDGASGAQTQI